MFVAFSGNTMANAKPKFREPERRLALVSLSARWREKQAAAEAAKIHAERAAEERRLYLDSVRDYRIIEWRPVGRRPIRDIIATVATFHGVEPQDITGASRNRAITRARFDAVRAVAEARPDMSLPMIGRVFNRDHTTILHALKRTRRPGQAR